MSCQMMAADISSSDPNREQTNEPLAHHGTQSAGGSVADDRPQYPDTVDANTCAVTIDNTSSGGDSSADHEMDGNSVSTQLPTTALSTQSSDDVHTKTADAAKLGDRHEMTTSAESGRVDRHNEEHERTGEGCGGDGTWDVEMEETERQKPTEPHEAATRKEESIFPFTRRNVTTRSPRRYSASREDLAIPVMETSEHHQALQDVAATGDASKIEWSSLVPIIRHQIDQNIAFIGQIESKGRYTSDAEEIRHVRSTIQRSMELFRKAPWTIQRLAELLVAPKYYTNVIKYLRALEKVVTVTSGYDEFPLYDVDAMEEDNDDTRVLLPHDPSFDPPMSQSTTDIANAGSVATIRPKSAVGDDDTRASHFHSSAEQPAAIQSADSGNNDDQDVDRPMDIN